MTSKNHWLRKKEDIWPSWKSGQENAKTEENFFPRFLNFQKKYFLWAEFKISYQNRETQIFEKKVFWESKVLLQRNFTIHRHLHWIIRFILANMWKRKKDVVDSPFELSLDRRLQSLFSSKEKGKQILIKRINMCQKEREKKIIRRKKNFKPKKLQMKSFF